MFRSVFFVLRVSFLRFAWQATLVMDITDGKMTDNTNVQQWSSNGLNCQKWTLRAFGSGNYYWIRSQQDSGYALKADGSKNGGNLAIAVWSN